MDSGTFLSLKAFSQQERLVYDKLEGAENPFDEQTQTMNLIFIWNLILISVTSLRPICWTTAAVDTRDEPK